MVCIINHTQGQSIDTNQVLKDIATEMKGIQKMSYAYDEQVAFPNGEKDNLKGTVSVDNEKRYMFNDCDAFTLLYTGKYFYRADHRKKTLSIVDLKKEDSKKLKKETEKEMFENGALNVFLDSVLLKKAIVKNFSKIGDSSIKLELVFPPAIPIQNLTLTYNRITKTLVSYNMHMFQPVSKKAGQAIGVKITMNAYDFNKLDNNFKNEQDKFFTFTKGKLEVKKYNNYKLIRKT